LASLDELSVEPAFVNLETTKRECGQVIKKANQTTQGHGGEQRKALYAADGSQLREQRYIN